MLLTLLYLKIAELFVFKQFDLLMTSYVFLTANKYIESLCEDVIRDMKKCCEVHAGENSVCCSGFIKEHTSTDTKTIL